MTPPDLMILAEKVEKAEGPARSLDFDIARACGWREKKIGEIQKAYFTEYRMVWISPDDAAYAPDDVPYFTDSIDAAIMSVPDGMTWNVTSNGAAIVGQYGGTPVHCIGSWDGWNKERPALALCAASLRARAAQGD